MFVRSLFWADIFLTITAITQNIPFFFTKIVVFLYKIIKKNYKKIDCVTGCKQIFLKNFRKSLKLIH